jgi:hypothetical protein
MSLSSVGNPAWEMIRGVQFAMLYGPTLVTIVVTHAPLSEIDDVKPGVGGHLACFESAAHAPENGTTAHQMMAMFGWLTMREAERYTREAQPKTFAADATRLLARKPKEEH